MAPGFVQGLKAYCSHHIPEQYLWNSRDDQANSSDNSDQRVWELFLVLVLTNAFDQSKGYGI